MLLHVAHVFTIARSSSHPVVWLKPSHLRNRMLPLPAPSVILNVLMQQSNTLDARLASGSLRGIPLMSIPTAIIYLPVYDNDISCHLTPHDVVLSTMEAYRRLLRTFQPTHYTYHFPLIFLSYRRKLRQNSLTYGSHDLPSSIG